MRIRTSVSLEPGRSILPRNELTTGWSLHLLSAYGSDAQAREGSSRPGSSANRPYHRIASRCRDRAAPARRCVRSTTEHSTHRGPVRDESVQPNNVEPSRDGLRLPREHGQIGGRCFRSSVCRWSSPGFGGLLCSRGDCSESLIKRRGPRLYLPSL